MRVFSYGTITNPSIAKRMGLTDPVVDTLRDHRLVSRLYLSVEERKSATVTGVSWWCEDNMLPSVDAYEAWPDIYQRKEVTLLSGTKAWVYYMVMLDHRTKHIPGNVHRDSVLGYMHFKLPQMQLVDAINEAERLAHQEYIDSLCITTPAQAEGYRRALELWDARHPKEQAQVSR